MEIKLTWHLLVMIVVTIYLLFKVFKEEGGLDFSAVFYGSLILIIWAIYGGITLW